MSDFTNIKVGKRKKRVNKLNDVEEYNSNELEIHSSVEYNKELDDLESISFEMYWNIKEYIQEMCLPMGETMLPIHIFEYLSQGK